MNREPARSSALTAEKKKLSTGLLTLLDFYQMVAHSQKLFVRNGVHPVIETVDTSRFEASIADQKAVLTGMWAGGWMTSIQRLFLGSDEFSEELEYIQWWLMDHLFFFKHS